jgi:hypothetical protein
MHVELMPEAEVAPAAEVVAPITAEAVVEAPEATAADQNAPDFSQIQAPTEAPAETDTAAKPAN